MKRCVPPLGVFVRTPCLDRVPLLLPYRTTTTDFSTTIAFRGAGRRRYLLQSVIRALLMGEPVLLRTAEPAREYDRINALAAEYGVWRDAGAKGVGKGDGGAGPVFGEYDFPATVGLWAEYGRRPAAGLLDPFAATEGLTFTPEEFVDLRDRLLAAGRRLDRLPAAASGLEDLHTGFFRHRSLDETTAVITPALDRFLARGEGLRRRYLLALHDYARRAAFARRAHLGAGRATLAALRDTLASLPPGGRRGRALERLRSALERYHREHYGSPPAELPPPQEAPLADHLAAETAALDRAADRLGRDLKADGLALSPLTVDPALGDAATLAELATELDELVRAVDEAGLYQLPVGGAESATTPRQLQQLDGLLARLRATHRALPNLPAFHARQRFWYAQPAHLRRLLAPLLLLPSEDWEPAFGAWYFDRCLERAELAAPAGLRPAELLKAPEDTLAESETFDSDLLTIIGPDDGVGNWRGKLVVDLTIGGEPLAAPVDARTLRAAPLHDRAARPVALAGLRRPSLAFVQTFPPLEPPAWQTTAGAAAPPGINGVALRPAGGNWRPLAAGAAPSNAALEIYLPRLITPADAAALLNAWENWLAAPALHFFHNLTPNDLTQALLTDGFTADFLVAALLRAAEAASLEPFDREAFVAMGREVRLRCGLPEPEPHPLAAAYARELAASVPAHRIRLHVPWRDTFLPLVVQAENGAFTVHLPGGRLPGYADDRTEAYRQRELRVAGYHLAALDAYAFWRDTAE